MHATALTDPLVDETRDEGLEDTGALAGEIEALRQRLGLSQEGIAQVLGVSRMALHTWRRKANQVPPYRRVRHRAQIQKLKEIAAEHDWDSSTRNMEKMRERDEFLECLLRDGGYFGKRSAGILI